MLRLQLHRFPLEMRIGNDAFTFHTEHQAGKCSFSVTWSEIMRLCVQMRDRLIGRVCETRPDSSWFTVSLDGK
jgi:hypothetical protein